MGKYTSLARKIEETKPQEGGSSPTDDILNVNINNIHSNRVSGLDKATPARPKDTLQRSLSVEMPQGNASSGKQTRKVAGNRTTNLRTTNLTNLTESSSVRCIHGTTEERCAVCSGYVRWLIADEDRLRRAQSNPVAVRREFWREVGV